MTLELPEYLRSLQQAELDLAESYTEVARSRSEDHATVGLFLALAQQGREHARALGPALERYGRPPPGSLGEYDEDINISEQIGTRFRILEFQDLYLSACLVDVGWAVLMQVGSRLEDRQLVHLVEHCASETGKQLAWIKRHIKDASHGNLLQTSPRHTRPSPSAKAPVAAGPVRGKP